MNYVNQVMKDYGLAYQSNFGNITMREFLNKSYLWGASDIHNSEEGIKEIMNALFNQKGTIHILNGKKFTAKVNLEKVFEKEPDWIFDHLRVAQEMGSAGPPIYLKPRFWEIEISKRKRQLERGDAYFEPITAEYRMLKMFNQEDSHEATDDLMIKFMKGRIWDLLDRIENDFYGTELAEQLYRAVEQEVDAINN